MLGELGLRHTVITCVDRDDLADGGAAHWAATIRAVKRVSPDMVLEVLTGDFKGDTGAVDVVLAAGPDVFAHNLETVPRLSRQVRVQASYARSYAILRHAKARGAITKTGLMLGLGEELDELRAVFRELREIGVDILTLGQYLRPSPKTSARRALRAAGRIRGAEGGGAGDGIPARRVGADGPLELPRRRPARHRAGAAQPHLTTQMIPYFSGHMPRSDAAVLRQVPSTGSACWSRWASSSATASSSCRGAGAASTPTTPNT